MCCISTEALRPSLLRPELLRPLVLRPRWRLAAALSIAAAGFLYVALADIVPSLHREHPNQLRQAAFQVVLLGVGVAIAAALASVLHQH